MADRTSDQCDGCRRGEYLREGMHYDSKGPSMACISNQDAPSKKHTDASRLERICGIVLRLLPESAEVGLTLNSLSGLQRLARAALDASRSERSAGEPEAAPPTTEQRKVLPPELREVHSDLIKLAAQLVRGEGVPDWSERKFYQSTPRAERRDMLKALRDADDALRVYGIRVREIADKLSRTTS
jgi:hypothetical protein